MVFFRQPPHNKAAFLSFKFQTEEHVQSASFLYSAILSSTPELPVMLLILTCLLVILISTADLADQVVKSNTAHLDGRNGLNKLC